MAKQDKKTNILVTSISSKTSLIYSIKENVKSISDKIKIFGIDSNEDCVAKYIVDSFHQIEKVEKIKIEKLIEKCIKWSILLIIPTRDEDVLFFSKHLKLINSFGISVMASNWESVNKCVDKYKFYLNTKMFCPIPTSLNINDLKINRFVVKDRYGSGSKKIGINLRRKDAVEFAKNIKSPLYQEYVTGREISIDAYVDCNKNIKGIVLRDRNLIIDGEAKVSKTFNNYEIRKAANEIICHLNLYGHIMLQMFVTENNKFFLIECNPRFGGASTLSIKAGLESFKWAYMEAMHVDISKLECKISRKAITQVRISNDIYI